MDMHQNARLTVHCRALLVERVLKGQPRREVAAQFGVSEKTVSKWLSRFRNEGANGLQDRSCRPRRSPQATVRELELAVVALRRQRLTLVTIAQQLGRSRATVARICARAGLNRLTSLSRRCRSDVTSELGRGSCCTWTSKKLGRITRVGHRMTGDRRDSVDGSGWEFVHIAIDDTSRVAYAQVLPDAQGDSAAAFLRPAVAYYAALGVVIRELLTDNGVCYRSRQFAQTCRDLGLRRRFTRPYTLRTNGKAERFVQTALREWAYARAYSRSSYRIAELPRWAAQLQLASSARQLDLSATDVQLGLARNILVKLHS